MSELFEETIEYPDDRSNYEDFKRTVLGLIFKFTAIDPDLDFESVKKYLHENELIYEYIKEEYDYYKNNYIGGFSYWIDAVYNVASNIYDGLRFG